MNMKRLFIGFAAAMVLVMAFGSLEAQAGRPKKDFKSDEQKIAEDPNRTTMRAWGQYEDFPEMNLEVFAANDARAKLAEQTATLVSRSIDLYAESKLASDINKKGKESAVRAMKQKAVMQLKAASKEIIENSRVLQSSRYQLNKKSRMRTCCSVVEVTIHDVLLNINNTKEVKLALDDLEAAISGVEDADFDMSSSDFEASTEKSFQELKEGKLDASKL